MLDSRAPHLHSVIANATTSYAISFAANSECASTFLLLRDVIATCAEQRSPSASLEAA
jgi:hypothetical protein